MPLARWDEDASCESSDGAELQKKFSWRYDPTESSEKLVCHKFQPSPTNTFEIMSSKSIKLGIPTHKPSN